MTILDNIHVKTSTSGELLQLFLKNKRWWLVPMVVTLVLCGVLIALAESSAIAPFIYTLF